MEKPDISQVFYYVELKIEAYEIIVSRWPDFSREYSRELNSDIDYSWIDRTYFLFTYDELSSKLIDFINRIDTLKIDKTLELLAKADSICLEFGTLESCKKEIALKLENIKSRLEQYLNRHTSKHTLPTTPELKITILNGLINFDALDKSIFDKGENQQKLQENLNHFINGNFKEINPDLNFKFKDKELGYYLINTIVKVIGKELKDIKNVKINDDLYQARNASTAVAKLNNKINNQKLSHQKEIQLMEIENFLKTHINNYTGNL